MSNFHAGIIEKKKISDAIAEQRKAFAENGGVVQELGVRQGPLVPTRTYNNAKLKSVK